MSWALIYFMSPPKKINISTHTQFACWHFVHFVEPKHEIVIRKAVDKEKKQNHIVYTIYIISIGSRNSASDLTMILYSYTNAIDIFSRFLSIVFRWFFQLASRTGFAAARRTRLEFIQWAARLICVNSKFTRSVHKMAAALVLFARCLWGRHMPIVDWNWGERRRQLGINAHAMQVAAM